MNQLDPHKIYFDLWFQVVVSIVVSGIIVAIIAFSRKTPITTNSNTYLDQSKSHLRFHHDNYIRTVVTKQKKPSNNNNSSGSGHSSSGPSGHSHSSGSSSF